MTLKPFWVSWYGHPKVEFEWEGPWWISGWAMTDDVDIPTICAAVMAANAEDAQRQIVKAHDKRVKLVWRFANERDANWSPFCDRFQRAGWMLWPFPEAN